MGPAPAFLCLAVSSGKRKRGEKGEAAEGRAAEKKLDFFVTRAGENLFRGGDRRPAAGRGRWPPLPRYRGFSRRQAEPAAGLAARRRGLWRFWAVFQGGRRPSAEGDVEKPVENLWKRLWKTVPAAGTNRPLP